MQKNMIENQVPSLQGISGIRFQELDLMKLNSTQNRKQSRTQSRHSIPYMIQIKAPEGQLIPEHQSFSEYAQSEGYKVINKNPYNQQTTGYDINRELFSDDAIRQAFNAIDINNDGAITNSEISFFLKCMGQPHTKEEVQEMVRIVSNDGKKVMFEDFKKIGKGKIPTFAAIRQPEDILKQKQIVLQNIQETHLSNVEPEQILELKNEIGIDYQKYEQELAHRHRNMQKREQLQIVEENGGMKRRTAKQIHLKRQLYNKMVMLNIDKAIQALSDLNQKIVDIKEVAEALSISDSQTRSLFQRQKKMFLKQALLDIILFSNAGNLRKLQLIFMNAGFGKTLSIEQWLSTLQFLMGQDQSEFIRKRLQSILRHRKIMINGQFEPYFILQIMSQEQDLFIW